jgi:predicted AlkP superfamily phosphohydrolase/phosphomutase
VRDEIRELFLAARCRWPNGEETPAFPEVHTTEELYGRERHADDDWFPDLLLVPAPGLSVVRKIRGNSLVRWVPLRRKEGTHRPEGIFLVNGPSVRAGHRQNSQIADVTPTILAALGLPVPDDMDGSVITEVFSPPLTPVYETPVEHHYDRTEQHVYSPQEEAALTQRLADLGYL